MQKNLSSKARLITQSETWTILLLIFAHLFTVYIDNFPTISLNDLFKEITFQTSKSAIIAAIVYLFLRNWIKAASITLITIAFEFYFSLTHSFTKLFFGVNFLTSYSFILPVGVLLFGFCCVLVTKYRSIKLLKLSNYYSIAIVCYATITSLIKSTNGHSGLNKNNFLSIKNKPSIILIVLDEYAGKTSLQSHFQFDNTEFSNRMKELNFKEVEDPRSIYNSTIFSMASFFAMKKLDLSSLKVSDIPNRRAAIKTINDNLFIEFLKYNKYNIHNHSIFPFNYVSPPGDYFKLHVVGSDLLSYYNTSNTIFRDLSYHLYRNEVFGFSQNKLQMKWANGMNDFLDETASMIASTPEKENFHYVHFVMPHAPFLYKSDGTMRPAADLTNDSSEIHYLDYLKYSNNRIIDWLKNAIQGKKETIVIVMSDHGWKTMKQPSPDKIEFNTILFVRGLSKEIPEGVIVPNILPYVLENLGDTTIKKINTPSIYLYD